MKNYNVKTTKLQKKGKMLYLKVLLIPTNFCMIPIVSLKIGMFESQILHFSDIILA